MDGVQLIPKSIPLMCRNSLTGEISEFGLSSNEALRETLLERLEAGLPSESEGIFILRFDELSFCALGRIAYLDSEGKKRLITYSKQEIQSYCDDIVTFLRGQMKNVIDYTHDIQYLIGSLNALSVQKKSQMDDIAFFKSRLEKINLLSIIISAKSAYFRFITEDIELMDLEDVSIEGKTFKIFKGIDFIAESRKKRVNSSFNSSCKSTVKMPDIFEFIPYSLIENAIKYSPNDMDVDIDVRDGNDSVYVDVSSMGPLIEHEEYELIFHRGYRGRAVRGNPRFPGHGLGLFQASRASRVLFGGKITVRQELPSLNLNGLPYAYTTFTIVVPKKSRV